MSSQPYGGADESLDLLCPTSEIFLELAWGQINFEMELGDGLMEAKCMEAPSAGGNYAMDIEPDDIEVTDTVTVVWEIE